MKHRSLRFYILSTIVFSVILYAAYQLAGIFPEDHTESELAIHHNGIFLQAPATLFNNWNVFTLITYPIVFLKKLFPTLNIHGLFLCSLLCIVFANYFNIITQFLQTNTGIRKKPILYSIAAVVMLSILINELLYMQYIKVAIHLLASGILLFNISRSRVVKAAGFMSACFGAMLRYEAAMIVFPLLLAAFLLLREDANGTTLLEKAKSNFIFVAFVALLIFFCNHNYTKADKKYYPYHAIVNTIADFRFDHEGSAIKSKLDAAKLSMAQHYYYNDTNGLSIREIIGLGIQPVERNPFDLIHHFDARQRFTRGTHDFSRFIRNNATYLFLYACCYLLLLLLIPRKYVVRSILYLLLCLALLLCMSIYMDLQDRFGIPVLTFAFILNLKLWLDHYTGNKNRIAWLLLIFSFGGNVYNSSFKVKNYLEIQSQSAALQRTLDASGCDIVFWDFYLFPVLDNKIAANFPLYNSTRDYSIDFPFGFAIDAYTNKMQERFHTTQLIDIVIQSAQNKNIAYFTTRENLAILINYLNLQYGRNFSIHQRSEKPLFINKLVQPEKKYYLFYLSE